MNLYEAISCRKSIRKYKKNQVSDKILEQIKRFLNSIAPLEGEIQTETEIIDNTRGAAVLKGIWKVEAPYYLVFFSEEKKGYERNVGYLAEQIVLYLTTKGLGTCYLGGSKVVNIQRDGLKQVIVIAFGYADGILYREAALAKRLSLKELCVFREGVEEPMKTILKAARLAPSSLNSQPWRFLVYPDKIYLFACKDLFPITSLSSMREINIGITLSHIMIASEELWMEIEMEAEGQFQKKGYKNGEYITTILLK